MRARFLLAMASGAVGLVTLSACGGSGSATTGKSHTSSPTTLQTLTAPSKSREKPPTPGPTATTIPASDFTATVSGVVTDHKSHAPVSGATIVVGNHLRTTKTDAQGKYSVAFPARASIGVIAEKPGYAGALAVGKLPPNGKVTLNLQIVKSQPGVPPVPPMPVTFGSR